MKRLLCLLALASAIGCTPKLDYHDSFVVDLSKNPSRIFDAVRADQKVKIDVQAAGGPVDVYVFLEKNQAAVEAEMLGKKGSSWIAEKKKVDSATFDVTIPAKESWMVEVIASTPKKANVTLKVTN
jgi:hypothetical protein